MRKGVGNHPVEQMLRELCPGAVWQRKRCCILYSVENIRCEQPVHCIQCIHCLRCVECINVVFNIYICIQCTRYIVYHVYTIHLHTAYTKHTLHTVYAIQTRCQVYTMYAVFTICTTHKLHRIQTESRAYKAREKIISHYIMYMHTCKYRARSIYICMNTCVVLCTTDINI